MKSIVLTYPDFHSLPKGLKMLLVESEYFFYREVNSPSSRERANIAACRSKVPTHESRFSTSFFIPPDLHSGNG
ncbi:MAG TPA: hypothetical protein VIV82_03880, partial [Verrucomicrobiae bacterium]